MNARTLTELSSAMLLLAASAFASAQAQETSPQSAPAPAAQTPPASDPKSEQAERDSVEPAVSEPATTQGTESTPAATPSPAPAAPSSSSGGSFRTMDRLELESSAITGNRELPKVLYIVPWKKADLGDLIGRPANSLLDEVLTPVDRDVFRRQTDYYTKLQGTAEGGPAASGAAAPPPTQTKTEQPPR